jgi:predicted dinucleotide-binding enzyme
MKRCLSRTTLSSLNCKVVFASGLSNDRGPDSLREIVDQLGLGAVAVPKEAAASCEMVLLAVPRDYVPPPRLQVFPGGKIRS